MALENMLALQIINKLNETNNGTSKMYYTTTDHLGSINMIVDEMGIIQADMSYDAWGRRRNAQDWSYTLGSLSTTSITDRGYTGHEHMDAFNLINMNGRAYDAKLGQFLSPDPFVQAPENTQSYNRYAYCLNNPLKYTDPSGYMTYTDWLDWEEAGCNRYNAEYRNWKNGVMHYEKKVKDGDLKSSIGDDVFDILLGRDARKGWGIDKNKYLANFNPVFYGDEAGNQEYSNVFLDDRQVTAVNMYLAHLNDPLGLNLITYKQSQEENPSIEGDKVRGLVTGFEFSFLLVSFDVGVVRFDNDNESRGISFSFKSGPSKNLSASFYTGIILSKQELTYKDLEGGGTSAQGGVYNLGFGKSTDQNQSNIRYTIYTGSYGIGYFGNKPSGINPSGSLMTTKTVIIPVKSVNCENCY